MMVYKFTSPLLVVLPRTRVADKRVYLNLNKYRNLNHFMEGEAKKVYCKLMKKQLENLKFTTPIKITCQLFRPDKTKVDKDNAICITKKYFFDALTHYKCIPDDNDDYIKEELSLPTIYDKGDGRVEILVEEC